MKEEKSCGAVVYKTENGVRLYLVGHTPSGKTVIPKGHVEGAETEVATALREIREEKVARYSPKPGVMKDVVFFTAVPLTEELIPQPGEMESLEWLPYERAREQMTYPSVRAILEKAHRYLSEKEQSL